MKRALPSILSRQFQFIFLAFTLTLTNTFTTTLASSTFLSNAGADSLPIYYVIFSAVSIPVSLAFSTIIDKWPRSRIFQAMLLTLLVQGVALPLLPLVMEAATAGTIAYLGFSICEMLLYSVYYVLFADHFTATEANRLTTPVAMSMAMGGIAGAGLVGGIAALMPREVAAMAAPLLAGLVLMQSIWLSRREEPLDECESAADEGVWDSIRILPKVASRYPIIAFMAAAVFLNTMLQCMAEYAAFSIYSEHYPDEDALTAFLGLANAGINVVGVIIVLAFTNPLLPRLGVARMNVCVPLFNSFAFGVLALWNGLPAGVLSHINYDAFENNAGVPVFSMNYNAMPHRFVGRIRVFNDGAVYPLALLVAGLVLLVLDGLVPLSGIAVLCVGLSVVFLLVALRIKRHYVHGLIEMLRNGSMDLDAAGKGFRPPPEYVDDIITMLDSPDADTVFLGLEMAVRCDSTIALARAGDCLPKLDPQRGRTILHDLLTENRAGTIILLRDLCDSPMAELRRLGLGVLGEKALPLDGCDMAALAADNDESVAAMARVLNGAGTGDTARLSTAAAQAVIDITASLAPRDAARIIRAFGDHPAPQVRAAALIATTRHAQPGDSAVMPWARKAAQEANTEVRAAALAALTRLSLPVNLPALAAAGLGDDDPMVRRLVAAELGQRGTDALPAVAAQLRALSPATCHAALDALGLIGGKSADQALFAFLSERVYPQTTQALALQKRVPGDGTAWAALRQALDDVNQQSLALVLAGLGAMGYQRILGSVRAALAASEPRVKSNALETLASLAHRHYVLPLLPLLEQQADAPPPARPTDAAIIADILTQALALPSPWVRAAALAVWRQELNTLAPASDDTEDAVVAETRARLAAGTAPDDKDLPMNRLAFLKSVSLFQNMSLDNLVALDHAMSRETYLAGEDIVREGESGDRLYVIFRGAVTITKHLPDGPRQLATLHSGQIFGEMSIFEAETRSATVTATEETEVLSLDQDHLHSLIQQRPEISVEMCKVLVRRLRKMIA
ncbi:cyclic nucleotide-binding domain-containing protein [Magnetospirillum gryphiswaldense]|uniref:cyclic nucleotide-binding domain-containing protein n=1 Tax=Magnetospirillum gryphiswaldense TaxID=55518 RepID=UPI000D02429A|nr:cyclic nucleotide-binding domain-containing protein [Magnetospirillum gryphiswaldense]AVM74216.1 cAMP receptor protein [Magnetospirillum gryphiswaldense MSR-1]AVM78119.1 cAMP receptor protein [Magnetospirillum gryphiswaldense]